MNIPRKKYEEFLNTEYHTLYELRALPSPTHVLKYQMHQKRPGTPQVPFGTWMVQHYPEVLDRWAELDSASYQRFCVESLGLQNEMRFK